ncbi:MAG: ferritin-like domain-containing protein [Actinomycetota bacterium]|nr:ferritin-like domain-containing protein [Actinomycetota bacterium]
MDIYQDYINRRRVLMFGGAAVATSAVLAACKGATPSATVVPPTSASTAIAVSAKDITILRTASSIEALAVAVYTTVTKSGLVKTTATLDLLKLFQTQHGQHGDLFQRATRTAGGTAFTDANPVLMQQVVQPRLAALKTEADVVNLAYDLEHLASATHQGDIGMFDNLKFNTSVASVGATEARHVALLAVISGKSATGTPDNAFQSLQDQVKPGIGV